MERGKWRRWLILLGIGGILYLTGGFLLGLVLPFALGLGVALLSRPAAQRLKGRFGWKDSVCALISAGGTLVLIAAVVVLLLTLAVAGLGRLVGYLPPLQQTARQGLDTVRGFLQDAVDRTPASIRPLLHKTVEGRFLDSQAMLESLGARLPGLAASVVSHLSQWVLGLGTAALAAFLFAVRLPKLRNWCRRYMPKDWESRWMPALKEGKTTLLGWLKAQGKLMLLTYLLVAVGFWILGISGGFFWAAGVALVDAVPMLGTGTVLLPWALISFLQGQAAQAMGLVAIFAGAFLLRTVLEPRLVGRHIGLDPLATLFFIYTGFRIWGVLGMIFCPMVAAAGKTVAEKLFKNNF